MGLSGGTKLGPYIVIGGMDAGGRAGAYRARDERDGSEVSILLLPEVLRRDEGRRSRFERDARALCLLRHPNLVAVRDVEAADATPYLVTELLAGETLRERLRGTPLRLTEAIDLAAQIARGLAAAHGRGLLHGDLTPENLLLTEGCVKLLGFGLGEETILRESHAGAELEESARVTITSVIVGTAGYIGPEQVKGAPPDRRSDIFSVGATLYEMLTGQPAFPGETPTGRVYATLQEEPLDLVASFGIPEGVAEVVELCLAKHPQGRFASASDLIAVLEALLESPL